MEMTLYCGDRILADDEYLSTVDAVEIMVVLHRDSSDDASFWGEPVVSLSNREDVHLVMADDGSFDAES